MTDGVHSESVSTSASAVDEAVLRGVLGRFATGVTIITCVDAVIELQAAGVDRANDTDVDLRSAAWVGLTANSFNSLSLDPPLVLWSLREASPALAAFAAAGRFAVNVLAETQIDLSRRFARRSGDKFEHGAWALGEHGAPVLEGCAAVFECETVSEQRSGDHRLFIGRVLGCSASERAPLIYQSGHYHRLGEQL